MFPVNELSLVVMGVKPGGVLVIVPVITAGGIVVEPLEVDDGKKVNTSPSVVTVVTVVRPVGTVSVSEPPMMMIPPDEMTTWLSGSVMVIPPTSELELDDAGKKVKTSPSVEIVVGVVRPVGTVSVSEPPMIITPDEEIIV